MMGKTCLLGERVFEEHEKVADCILSWPTRSQNMIFFEERDDHFGLIESPGTWLGDEFVTKYRYASADAMQMMLNNIEQAGFPEWRDYLYIRKPGDKTWSRRLCVLRSSGLYTSKKNRKVLNPYSAQDPASTHVFCFCATDETALRNWVARLRIAKYGRQLFLDYQSALARVQRQLALRHGPVGMNFGLNGSLSAGIHRKSSFDFLSTSSNPTLSTAESTTSLVATTNSPCAYKRYTGVPAQAIGSDSRYHGEERVSYNQYRTNSVPQQSSTGFERVAISPMSTATPHAHVGLRPQTPQIRSDPQQTPIVIRGGARLEGAPTATRIPHFPGANAQQGLRRT
ncbi:unnamed protein product [Echinostoma caproni]|uniref:Ras-associating domain-containing protein n=1 Tax=Echinostoma caproni TaxID=27848 RepID=A0A183AC45_9TREM|nr:unnamed protein product [Echinostoma caproni]